METLWGLHANEPLLGLFCNKGGSCRTHTPDLLCPAAHIPCGISTKMGGTGDGVPGKGESAAYLTPGCVEWAVGARVLQPHLKLRCDLSPFERHRAGCIFSLQENDFPARWEQATHLLAALACLPPVTAPTNS